MFSPFIRTKFNVFGTFENFDPWSLVLTKGVTCTMTMFKNLECVYFFGGEGVIVDSDHAHPDELPQSRNQIGAKYK